VLFVGVNSCGQKIFKILSWFYRNLSKESLSWWTISKATKD
jgi:hypothetical protein